MGGMMMGPMKTPFVRIALPILFTGVITIVLSYCFMLKGISWHNSIAAEGSSNQRTPSVSVDLQTDQRWAQMKFTVCALLKTSIRAQSVIEWQSWTGLNHPGPSGHYINPRPD